MAYSVNVKTREEFEELIYGKDLNISKSIVDGILKNLNTTKRHVHVLEIIIENEDKIMDLTVDRKDFIDTLEKNLEIHVYHEEYERCSKIHSAIEKLKNK
jgi:protein-arginine kinase activator protein McsA